MSDALLRAEDLIAAHLLAIEGVRELFAAPGTPPGPLAPLVRLDPQPDGPVRVAVRIAVDRARPSGQVAERVARSVAAALAGAPVELDLEIALIA